MYNGFFKKCPECILKRTIVNDEWEEITCMFCKKRGQVPRVIKSRYCLECNEMIEDIFK